MVLFKFHDVLHSIFNVLWFTQHSKVKRLRGFEKSIEDSAGTHLVDTSEAQSTYSIASVGMMHR